jgi:glutathione S-transferase
MSHVEVFGFPFSTYVQTALLAAAEKGVPATLTPVEFRAESHRALHPYIKMPALRHGSLHLYEAAAIAVYLDEAFDGPSLQPAKPEGRALMWQWISAANAYFYPAFVQALLSEDGGGEGAAVEQARALSLLDAALADRPYLAGEALTLADLFVAPMLSFLVEKKGGAAKLLADRTRVRAWLERVAGRESFGRLAAA